MSSEEVPIGPGSEEKLNYAGSIDGASQNLILLGADEENSSDNILFFFCSRKLLECDVRVD